MPSNPDHPPPATAAAASTVHPPPPKPNPKLLSLLLKALIMTFITTLFFLFLGVAAILLLLATAALHRHSNPGPNHSSTAAAGISLRDLKRRLPQFRFSRRVGGKGEGGEIAAGDECVVCLDSIRQGQWCRKLPGCGHLFHRRCVDPWLVKVPACPICRARVQLENSAEEEEGRSGVGGAWGFDWRNELRVW